MIDEELMPVAWHPTRWWNWCLPEDEKKRVEPIFTDRVGKFLKVGAKWWEIVKYFYSALVVYSLGVLKQFGLENLL